MTKLLEKAINPLLALSSVSFISFLFSGENIFAAVFFFSAISTFAVPNILAEIVKNKKENI